MEENQNTEKKSIRFLQGKKTDWNELAKDCVCFANSIGGFIFIGIEDREMLPPSNQKIKDRTLPEKIHKKIVERTTNVAIAVTLQTAKNNSEYILIQIFRSAQTIAATNDGKYYIRISDSCRPVPPDEMSRLAADKNAFIWEEQTNKKVSANQFELNKKQSFLKAIRNSSRVSSFVKEKSDDEIFEHYFLKKGNLLTNLGILWIGKRNDRAGLVYPPAIQVIRNNESDEKVWKLNLDDYQDNPLELLGKVINDVPDWQESAQIADGIFRKNIPFFPLEVVRELTANALVHRSYTTRGDIFINIFPDRFEIHSPGRLPFGVTPSNILNQSVRRNEHLSKDFELILSKGKTKGTLYFVNPEYLRKLNFKGKTTLKNIEDYRLEELIYKDIENYPGSAFGEIHQRIGKEINKHKIRRVMKSMVDNKRISCKGERRWRKYAIEQNLLNNQ
jgi:ATP-dependent DNA helicase RecG